MMLLMGGTAKQDTIPSMSLSPSLECPYLLSIFPLQLHRQGFLLLKSRIQRRDCDGLAPGSACGGQARTRYHQASAMGLTRTNKSMEGLR